MTPDYWERRNQQYDACDLIYRLMPEEQAIQWIRWLQSHDLLVELADRIEGFEFVHHLGCYSTRTSNQVLNIDYWDKFVEIMKEGLDFNSYRNVCFFQDQ